MDRTDRTKRKIGYITKAELLERAKNEFGPEYFPFWLIFLGSAPRVCPKCQSQSLKTLYLGLPREREEGKIWCKWYLWCDSCRYGIYCPPGTYWIPISEPHILWGDETALKENLPSDLKLIPRVGQMPGSDIAQVVATLRSSPELPDPAIFKKLVEQGVERCRAARLVEFLPMVYCRLVLAKLGVQFPGKFRRVLSDGTFSPLILLSSDALWNEAMGFAKAEIDSGVKGQELLAIAGRSAEFEAANKLLSKSTKPEDIRFTEPTLLWPEAGPEMDT